MENATPIIEFSNAVVMLNDFPALAGISLSILPSQIVALTGPNGAGKTTLLRTMAGLETIVRGQGQVLGFDLGTNARYVRGEVGLVGHKNALYEDLSVAENIRFSVMANGASIKSIPQALGALGLSARLENLRVKSLSQGQKRRVALACLVARNCRLWLLDEPHSGLDSSTRDILDDVISQQSSQGTTVVLCSHETERIQSLATHVVEIINGQVVQ